MANAERQTVSREELVPRVTRSLLDRLDVEVSPDAVERCVDETFTDLEDRARVKTFLPALTERIAADRLRHAHGHL
jgi:protein-tyrosine phosphatase-like protein